MLVRSKESAMTTKAVTIGLCALFAVMTAQGQTLKEYSSEARFQFDVHVPDAALAPFIPQGWTLNVATQGAAKDANLRVVFIDRQTINGPDGKPSGKGSNQLVW